MSAARWARRRACWSPTRAEPGRHSGRWATGAGAYSSFLLARPEVTGSAIGTTGYCLGGRMSLIAAGGLGRAIAAAASFHGGRLAVAGDPSSPHLSADRVAAAVYVAGGRTTTRSPSARPGYWDVRLPIPSEVTGPRPLISSHSSGRGARACFAQTGRYRSTLRAASAITCAMRRGL